MTEPDWSTRTPDAVGRTRLGNLRDDVAIGAVLVVIWTLLWGELSTANVVSGGVVAALVLIAFPVDHDITAVRHRPRPTAALALGAFFVSDLLQSTVLTALHVVRRHPGMSTGIVACPLRVQNDGLVTFMANVIALSPGTMPIEVAYNPHVIYVHSLRTRDPDDVRRFVSRLEELAVKALGGPEAVAAVARPPVWPPPPPEEPPSVHEVAT